MNSTIAFQTFLTPPFKSKGMSPKACPARFVRKPHTIELFRFPPLRGRAGRFVPSPAGTPFEKLRRPKRIFPSPRSRPRRIRSNRHELEKIFSGNAGCFGRSSVGSENQGGKER